jgi:hypothetical protein
MLNKTARETNLLTISGQGMRHNFIRGCAFFGYLAVPKALARAKTARLI